MREKNKGLWGEGARSFEDFFCRGRDSQGQPKIVCGAEKSPRQSLRRKEDELRRERMLKDQEVRTII